MAKNAANAKELQTLHTASALSDNIWAIVTSWSAFQQETVGTQLIRAVDAIGANIATAYGREQYDEWLRSLYRARGNVFETKYWLNRTRDRQVLSAEAYHSFVDQVAELARQLNRLLSHLRRQHYQEKVRHSPVLGEVIPDYEATYAGEDLFSLDDLSYLASKN